MENKDNIRGLLNPDDRDHAMEFQTIELDGQLLVHVVVEERCLYYLWLIVATDQFAQLQNLITQGQEEGRTRDLKRFELVIVTDNPEAFELDLMRARKELEGINEHTQIRLERPGV